MKTTWNYSRRLLPFFLCMLLSVFGNNAQTLPFRLSKGAGTFRLGVVCGNESCWLDQCSVKKKGQAYTIKDKLWKEGEIKLIVLVAEQHWRVVLPARVEFIHLFHLVVRPLFLYRRCLGGSR